MAPPEHSRTRSPASPAAGRTRMTVASNVRPLVATVPPPGDPIPSAPREVPAAPPAETPDPKPRETPRPQPTPEEMPPPRSPEFPPPKEDRSR